MDIIDQIYLQNPWFRDASFKPKEYELPKREMFELFYEEITKSKQVMSLTGLRRVGKSTMVKQVIAQLIHEKCSPRHILYFSFDQPTIIEEPKTLEKVIMHYFRDILNIPIEKAKNKIYFFFDEVQLIPFWQDIVKRFYDINQDIKFVVTGSSSLFIQEKSKESLAGRIFERCLSPLSFSEYKEFSKKNDFVDFLNFGQFPELLEIEDTQKKIDYLKEGVIGKILEIDIVKTYGIRKTVDFERLFWSLVPNTGQIIQSRKLMEDLGMKKATLFKYLSILEKSLLINKVLNLSGSFRSEARLLRKYYPASSNFLSLMPEPIQIGFKVETYTHSLLQKHVANIYLHNARNKEIDFILPDKKCAVEVKYKEHVHPSDYVELEKYIQEKKYKGIVVTKNKEKNLSNKNILFVPIEEFEKSITSI